MSIKSFVLKRALVGKKFKKEILIVDDSKFLRTIFSKYFKGQGYKVYLASDGQEALDLIDNRLPDNSFEAIISDCEMPIMDGKTFIKTCRSSSYPSYNKTCIILVSSKQVKDFKEANYFFLKPLALTQVQSQIELFWQNEQVEQSDTVEVLGEESLL